MSERQTRFLDLLPIERLTDEPVTVIGTGAIGRQVVAQLAGMGKRHIKVYDHDVVDVTNLGTQGWFPEDVGSHKVEALARFIGILAPDTELECHAEKWTRSKGVVTPTFACADSMAIRAMIYEEGGEVPIFDARMGAEVLRVFSILPGDREWYAETLHSDDASFAAPCTAKSTIYCASMAASMLVGQYANYIRDNWATPELGYNMRAMAQI